MPSPGDSFSKGVCTFEQLSDVSSSPSGTGLVCEREIGCNPQLMQSVFVSNLVLEGPLAQGPAVTVFAEQMGNALSPSGSFGMVLLFTWLENLSGSNLDYVACSYWGNDPLPAFVFYAMQDRCVLIGNLPVVS